MSSSFERIVNLMGGVFNGRVSASTLEHHCSAMRMDHNYSWTFNRLIFTKADAKADAERLAKADPVADLDGLLAEIEDEREAREYWSSRPRWSGYWYDDELYGNPNGRRDYQA